MRSKACNTLEQPTLLLEGESKLSVRDLDCAVDLFNKAAQLGVDLDRCSSGLWTAYMLLGNFELAWRQSDVIRKRAARDPHRFWQGESIEDKRVIVRFLHGYGDAVQFLSYVPHLRERAVRLIVEVPPRFVPLAHGFDGVDEIITWGKDAPEVAPEWDVQIEGNELPYLFRTQVSDLPIAMRYLHLARNRTSAGQHGSPDVSASSGELRVGLAWTAGEWNLNRCIPLEVLRPVLETSGCKFWSLQQEKLESIGLFEWRTSMLQEDMCRQSIEALAETISRLDLVITVDTLSAHLAGALGVRAWVLLQHEADWRWMHQRIDSPWYPSLRLFRQPKPGDWKTVADNLRTELSGLVATHTQRQAMDFRC